MKRIIYTNHDGGVSVVMPSLDYTGTIEELVALAVPVGTDYSIVEHTDLPSDRTFRNAWYHDVKGAVKINTIKAKEIWRDKWREARKPLLAELDTESIRAQEDSDNAKKNKVKQDKQALRDVTLTALPDDIEGIRAVWPAILGEKP